MRRTSALALATTTALLLTACTAGSQDGDEPAATTDGTTPATEAPATEAPAGEAPAADASDDEPLAPATAECLLGTWELDLAAMQDDLRRMASAGGGAVTVEVTGTSTYEFAEGGRFTSTVDSSSTVAMSADDSDLTSSSVSTGVLTGAWALDADSLVISDVDTSELEVATTATLDGEDLEVPDGTPEDAIEVLPPTASTASCGADRLTLQMSVLQDEDADPVSITYVLRR
ncbi:hypothetical protein [Cellulomonas sp. S1-8]|uniref:hypothetical protein n=1 Tax=Cellulomonas sp. S1-8 TaxID=2904790 RepID=UPI002244E86A|nr:hypothetical protein [Cellulomonas sp. S1-8]UZN02422.1 hypothetical protein OKX07_15370 [Cellulomonas sp. S1-8]